MARWSWNWAAEPRALVLAVVAGTAVLAGCGTSERNEPGTSGDGAVVGALPTPAGTSGGSVTGMPTSPPVRSADEVAEATPDAEPAMPADAVPPADPDAIPIDPATGLAAAAPPPTPADGQPADVAPAGDVVRDYMASLGAGAFAAAQQLWSTPPNDAAVMQLARGDSFAVDVLAPVRPADPAAAGVASVPVRVRGTADDGSERSVSVVYTVRRTADGPWRIAGANVREDAP